MPVEWTISHPQRLVLAVARGEVDAPQIEDYLHAVSQQGGMAYAKIFHVAESSNALSPQGIDALGEVVRRYARTGPIGPLAIVANSDEAYEQAGRFARAATVERPLRVFREFHEASRWIKELQESAAPAAGAAASNSRTATAS